MTCQAQHVEMDHVHFAFIYIDTQGRLHLHCSRSIAKTCRGVLEAKLTDAFLEAVRMSGESCSPINHASSTAIIQRPLPPQMARITHRETSLGGKAQIRRLPHSSQFPPTARPVHTESSSRWGTQNLQRTKRDVWSDDNKMFRGPQAMISIIDRNLLRKYYEKAFGHLQQTNCRILAKAYVKLVEPRKQVNYPYNGRKVAAGVTQQLDPEATKPPWWPPGRIRLLIHILCQLHTSHGITTRKLNEADQPIRQHISPAGRLCILDEVYRVRQQEMNFLQGKIGGQWSVSICRMNLPEPVGVIFNPNGHSGESISFDPASINISNNASPCAESGFTNNAPPELFVSEPNFSTYSLPGHPYNVHDYFPEINYAGPDPKILLDFDTTVPVSTPAQGLKRKRESEEIAHVHATRPLVSTHDPSPSASVGLQSYAVKYPGGSYSFLQ
ncbi:hypothetical protein N7541_007912 [Penicillium brevicompactum]|uniref:Subtelomeric hrmA-associated cluster protein AFUB-079030/YDR124W-like helical bundle domain-containing protein n=1 Tax=Penicillium brevicompactum TaxID=5074 RepID=A0A9W9UNZ1_PENBR|nr:hypothetical protein N7541_007912 [Penicillium brevicompactum]